MMFTPGNIDFNVFTFRNSLVHWLVSDTHFSPLKKRISVFHFLEFS